MDGKFRYVIGDVCEPFISNNNEIVVIPHCCNNGTGNGIGVMGAGVALSLRKKWPSVYDEYKKMEGESVNGLKNRLGDVCFSKVTGNIIVANMIAQNGIVSYENPIPLKYAALVRCMEKVRDRINQSITPESVVIHTPKFGSDLAGGKWEFFFELIHEIWILNGINIVIYEYDPDKRKWGEIPESCF